MRGVIGVIDAIRKHEPTFTLAQLHEAIKADREMWAGLVEKMQTCSPPFVNRADDHLRRSEVLAVIRNTEIGEKK